MAVATFVAAFTPLFIPLSPKRLTSISTFAVGLLVGAALSIVVPEGVAAVYSSAEEHTAHRGDQGEGKHEHEHGMEGWIGGALLGGFILMYLVHALQPHDSSPSRGSYAQHRHRASVYRASSELEPLATSSSLSLATESPSRDSSPPPREFDWNAPCTPAAGDVFGSPRGRNSVPSSPRAALERLRSYERTDRRNKGHGGALSTVIGLLVHSLADGISLGASSLSGPSSATSSLDLIIFFAIILHKAPTAFALSSLLISSSSSTTFIRRSLVAFSFATPIGALLTYTFLRLIGVGENSSTSFWTGLALVFSGGTFLFVATHVMEEKQEDDARDAGGESSEATKVALVIGGMVTPSLLSRIVGHGH